MSTISLEAFAKDLPQATDKFRSNNWSEKKIKEDIKIA